MLNFQLSCLHERHFLNVPSNMDIYLTECKIKYFHVIQYDWEVIIKAIYKAQILKM